MVTVTISNLVLDTCVSRNIVDGQVIIALASLLKKMK